MSIADVIGWKHNHQEGMRCKEVDGVLTIVEFPGGIPSQADQDLWTAEYEAAGGAVEIEKDRAVDFSTVDPFLKAVVLCINDGTIIPGANVAPAALKAAVRAKL